MTRQEKGGGVPLFPLTRKQEKHMQINQGYRIIERFPIGGKGFVLGYNPDAPNPYVTWQYRADDSEHYFWGHYHNEKEAAYQDYLDRIEQEAEQYQAITGSPYPLPKLCLTVQPGTGDIVNIARGIKGYYPSDWNQPGNRTYNRETAENANQQLGVTKAQEAAMLAGSMFGWDCPAAHPQLYDAQGKLRVPNGKEHPQERGR